MSKYKSALKTLTLGLSTLALVAGSQISRADAASVLFSGTGTNSASGGSSNALGASVLFDDLIDPGKLTITLKNTGPGATVPSDILTAVFWDYDNDNTALNTLSLFSATAPTVVGRNPGTNVNLASPLNEWKLPQSNGTSALSGITQNYGLGTAGLGIFQGTGGQQFNYGIISGYDSSNPAVSDGTFVKDSATFVLAGLPSTFNIQKISNVRFQYGTAISEPSFTASTINYSGNSTTPTPPPSGGGSNEPKKIPEPATTTALGLLVASALGSRKRKAVAQA